MSDTTRLVRAVGTGVMAGAAAAMAGYLLHWPLLRSAVVTVGLFAIISGLMYTFYVPR